MKKRLLHKRSFAYKLSLYFIMAWALLSILAPMLANERPLFAIDDRGWHFPAFESKAYVQLENPSIIIRPLIPYLPGSLDMNNANAIGPFDEQKISSAYYRHWLGTDELGRDVLSQLLHGSKTALLVGILSMLLAGIIGVIMGISAALLGDDSIEVRHSQLMASILLIPLFLISTVELVPWKIASSSNTERGIVFIALLLVYAAIYYLLIIIGRKLFKGLLNKKVKLPVDLLIGRLIELIEATPLLFLIVALAALLRPSLFSIIIVIGITGWAGIAKYARSEALKIREEHYIEAARAAGLRKHQIILKHILPNAISPVITSLAFGVAAAILIEASLSFIGFGLSPSDASWGQLLATARNNYQAWWLALFPGMAIFLTVFSCNTLGERLSE